MQVTLVVGVEGKRLTLEVDPSDDVDLVKEAVRDKHGVEVDRQRLILGGNQLDGGRTWSDYNIKGNVSVHVVIK